ncbi:hypothetical protein [Streptomyces jumonjinensis]|uniref:hypothetical protein n=1 Tax=Streptomyces jumonjinensis TaxID=1945 RepID=UPI0037BAC9D4
MDLRRGTGAAPAVSDMASATPLAGQARMTAPIRRRSPAWGPNGAEAHDATHDAEGLTVSPTYDAMKQ